MLMPVVLLAFQVFDIPFNSANKWSLAVTSCPGDSSHQLVMMKGAPEIILGKCTHHLHNKQEKEIDDVRGNLCKERSVCWLGHLPVCCMYDSEATVVHYHLPSALRRTSEVGTQGSDAPHAEGTTELHCVCCAGLPQCHECCL